MTAPTRDDLMKAKMEYAAHVNGGAAFFGHLYRSSSWPRLARFDKYVSKGRTIEVVFMVDGEALVPVVHGGGTGILNQAELGRALDAVIAALATPAAVSGAERAVRRRAPRRRRDRAEARRNR